MSTASGDILEELKGVQRALSDIVAALAGSVRTEDVWLLYAKAERIAAVLKFRLEVERPGVFSELPRSETPEEFLAPALDALDAAISALEAGRFVDGLESVRLARTNLRAFLASRARIARRAKRANRTSTDAKRSTLRRSRSSPSSSSPSPSKP